MGGMEAGLYRSIRAWPAPIRRICGGVESLYIHHSHRRHTLHHRPDTSPRSAPRVRVYVCMRVCVCMYAGRSVCMYVCMNVCICMYECVFACMHTYIHKYKHAGVCMYTYTHRRACKHVCMYVCMYECMYVSVYAYWQLI